MVLCGRPKLSMLLYLQELGVDLELRHGLSLLDGSLLALLYATEEVGNCPRDDSKLLVNEAHVETCAHGVRLPRTRLGGGGGEGRKTRKIT